jgi:hypothetical protein
MARDSNPLRHALAIATALAATVLPRIAPAAPDELFGSDAPFAIRLEAPFTTVLRQRADPEYQPARIVMSDESGADVAIDLRVRVRGRSRVTACAFPPLLLNFPGEQPAGSPFATENRLKLVTYCDARAGYEQYNTLERQIYRVLNLLTDSSLRIRPVTVTYFDSGRARELITKPGFLIEDEERFAKRSGLTTVSDQRVDTARYDPEAFVLLDTFEYFIGNTDWSAAASPAGSACCHNVVPFVRADGVLVPVPYDFDASGIVNAPYALPDERLPIANVRARLYRGRCRDMASYAPAFARFTERRAAIEALFAPAAGLSEKASAGSLSYIAEFYATIGDAAKAEKAFGAPCAR